jgi:DNA-binding NtrC family response regulator
MNETVIVIEDDDDLRSALGRVLEDQALRPILFAHPDPFLERLDRLAAPPDLIVTDLRLARLGRADLLAVLRADDRLRHVPVVVFTGWYDTAKLCVPVVPKPDVAGLVHAIHGALPHLSADEPPAPSADVSSNT